MGNRIENSRVEVDMVKNYGTIEYERCESGEMVMVTTRWGVKTETPAIEGDYPTGFSHIWRSGPELSKPERERQELEAFAESLRLVTDKSPALLAVGSGSPIFPDYAGEMAARMGWSQTETSNDYLACNSGVEALRRVLMDPRFLPRGVLEGREVIVGGWEGLTRMVDHGDPDNTDPLSRRVFSNGGALLKFVPGRDLSLVTEVFFSREDDGNLAAVMPYTIDPDGPLVQIEGNTKKIRLPVPEPGVSIWMKAKPTAKMFVRAFEEGIEMLLAKYLQGIADKIIADKPISLVTGHHPSTGPFLLTQKILERVCGISAERYPWVVDDGNSSGATAPKALNKLLGRVRPGERIMYVGYGGGISFTGIIMDRG